MNHITRSRLSLATGWLATARRHLLEVEPCAESSRVAATSAMFAVATGRFETALIDSEEALRLARRFGDADSEGMALAFRGYALVRLGRWEDGFSLLDEAMALALSGRLGPLGMDQVFCRSLSASIESWDYRRAAEWCDAVFAGGAPPMPTGIRGDCRTHRVAVHIVRGDWVRGEEDAALACVETEAFDLSHVGAALVALADLRRRRGDLDGAASALLRAHAVGGPVQPGMALLELARGEPDRAAEQIRTALAAAAVDVCARAGLLAAQVDIATAAGDAPTARGAADELVAIADEHPGPAFTAAARSANGAVCLLEGDPAGASVAYRDALRAWQEVGAPYEAARARLGLGRALNAAGGAHAAALELSAANVTFERLGALLDMGIVENLLATG